MGESKKHVIGNPWDFLRQFTPARLALGRAGESLPTEELLKFQAAHARARDAVHSKAEFARIRTELSSELGVDCVELESAARDRWEYLKRPDLGRKLSEASRKKVEEAAQKPAAESIAIIVGDGLSATAINLHAKVLLQAIHQEFFNRGWKCGPVYLASQARVALGDEIGEILGASASVVLIGERPGLSNVDSIGAYLTFGPKKGRTDAERNCISNICPAGLPLEAAAGQVGQLLWASLRNRLSGVALTELMAGKALT